MEELTKQQIVLLTLLVSFVTSLATGIITVSLMDKDSTSITQTINRVVERTVERVSVAPAPSSVPAAAVVAVQPTFSQIVEKVGDGIVKIKPRGSGESGIKGVGLILSQEGLVLTDKSVLGLPENTSPDFVAILSNGEEYTLQVVQSEIIGDVAFGALLAPTSKKLQAVTWSSTSTSIKLGDSVYTLSGELETGIVKKLGTSPTDPIETTIPIDGILAGSPLFTSTGEVIGFKTKSFIENSAFYPVSLLKTITPRISR